MAAGVFVVFEGGEGSGKGSAIAAASSWLTAHGIDHLCTREPGGTPEGRDLRRTLVERGVEWDSIAELLLMAADRRQHIAKVIGPALAKGQIVLCDRFAPSTEAYQGAGRQLPVSVIAQAHILAAGALQPQMVVLLDVDPWTGLQRSQKRLRAQASAEDRFEGLDLAFHQRVRNSYLQQAARDPTRWVVVDAMQSPEAVAQQAINAVRSVLPLHGHRCRS